MLGVLFLKLHDCVSRDLQVVVVLLLEEEVVETFLLHSFFEDAKRLPIHPLMSSYSRERSKFFVGRFPTNGAKIF